MDDRSALVGWFDTLRGDGIPGFDRVAGLCVMGGIGAVTFGVHLVTLLTRSDGLYVRLLGIVVPLCLSAVLLAMAVHAHRRHAADAVARIGAWCFVCAVVIATVGVVSIAHQWARGVTMRNVLLVLLNHATVGAILGALIGSYDSQRHRRGRDLRTEHERAQRLSDRLTILNRVFRHDIRNAVNVILGHTDRIRKGRNDRDQSIDRIDEKARELQAVSERARRLERLLDLEQAATSPIDIADSLRSKAAALASDGPAEVETEIPASAEVCSTPLIEEAIDELLHNAVEHNDAATPRLGIRVRSTDCEGDAGRVAIRIEDNGPGIPEHEIRVLERGHETKLHHSSGLGLWFVHWVVDASGGQMVFGDNEPRGSVVELRLPAPASDAGSRDGGATIGARSGRAFDRRGRSAGRDR